jgi:hypothetical protein
MEAKLARTDEGLVPEGEGWYVLNAREAQWFQSDEFGSACTFETDIRFPEFGINIGVMEPGHPLAQRYGASAELETPDPKEAYARFDQPSLGPAPELP